MNMLSEHSQELSKSVCPKCKNKIEEDYNFCPTCGFELNTTISPEVLLEKMAQVMDKTLFNQVDIQDMIIHQFVIVNIRDGHLFVAVHENTVQTFVVDLLQQKFDYPIKYIMLSTRRDFATLLLKCIIRVNESKV